MAILNHPAILLLLGVAFVTRGSGAGGVGGGVAIITEYVSDGDLARHLALVRRNEHPSTVGARARLLATAAQGLAYLHSRNLIHRDVKPSNILIRVDRETGDPREVKLSDFGLTSGVGSRDRGFTPRYAAPEVLRSFGASSASDSYSFGIVVAETITLARGKNETHRMMDVAARPVVAEVCAQVGGWLGELMLRAWMVKTYKRPAVEEFAAALEAHAWCPGCSAVMWAIHRGEWSRVQEMITQAAVDFGVVAEDGSTGLHVLARKVGNEEAPVHAIAIGNELVVRGCDVNAAAGRAKDTALLLAARGRDVLDVSFVRMLIDLGADLGLANTFGETALHVCCTAAMAEALMENGGDIDAVDGSGASPLHAAVHRGAKDVASVLLGAGCDFRTRDAMGRTPMDLGNAEGRGEIVSVIDAHMRDSTGPLYRVY